MSPTCNEKDRHSFGASTSASISASSSASPSERGHWEQSDSEFNLNNRSLPLNGGDNHAAPDSTVSLGTFIDGAFNSLDFQRIESLSPSREDNSRVTDYSMTNNPLKESPVENKGIPHTAQFQRNRSLLNYNIDIGTNGEYAIDDAAIERLAVQVSDMWKKSDGSKVSDYKHDDNGNLVIQDTKHHGDKAICEVLEKVNARELMEMDKQEREAITNEMHGVKSRSVQETPSMISSALQQLRREIGMCFHKELENQSNFTPSGIGDRPLFTKEAYRRGLELRSDYIQSDTFLLRFLRAVLFDVPKAAQRYFHNLDVLYSFFGDDALKRPLFLTDLTKRELRYLRKGQQQIFPSCDSSGRRIIAYLGADFTEFTIIEKFRVRTYLFEVLAQSETAQKLGYVQIGMIQKNGKINLGQNFDTFHMKRWHLSCPLRSASNHVCIAGTVFVGLIRACQFALFNRDVRSKVIWHTGSQIENNYNLCAFGISAGDIPMTYDGKIKVKHIGKFIRARHCIENFQKSQLYEFGKSGDTTDWNSIFSECPLVECPDNDCVVFGDKNMYDHPPNVRIRNLIVDLELRRIERIAQCDETVTASVSGFVNEIIHEAQALKGEQQKSLRFYSYEKDISAYKEIAGIENLNKRFLHVLRDVRKRSRGRMGKRLGEMVSRNESSTNQEHQEQEEPILDQYTQGSILGLESYKRAKIDEDSSGLCSSC